MDINTESLRFILGIKLKQFRQEKKYSLKDLAEKTRLSISYLSEIEKGKKYPKPGKIAQLAKALDISFDDLVSLKVNEELDLIKTILNSPFFQRFPFHLFGIAPKNIFDLITSSPTRAGSLIRTLLEISRSYDMQLEHILLIALRSYQQMHQNYFEDIENAVANFIAEHQWKAEPPIYNEPLRKVLIEEYDYVLDETTLDDYLDLQEFRSVWINKKPPRLLINRKLLPRQKAFLLGREIGYCYLGLKERATTSPRLKVESFEQLLNHFKASYFSGALLINQHVLYRDLVRFFHKDEWDGEGFLILMKRYEATPEMFLQRLNEIIPKFFGLQEVYFLRFNSEIGSDRYLLTKELHMSQRFVPKVALLNEHHCRRWLSIRLLNELSEKQRRGNRETILVAAQRSRYINIDTELFSITLARPLALSRGTNSSITLSFLMNEEFKKTVRFWDDSNIPQIEVNETCERCSLSATACRDRAAPSVIEQKEQTQKIQENALQQLIQEV